MLCGMAGKIAGYAGDFAFESGAKYPETFNYYVMRFVLTIFGALQAPVVYKTAIQLRFTQQAAVFACLLSLFDIAFLVISRFILLDGMLIFFTITTTFFLCLFINEQEYPFSLEWWFALLMTGISIGLVSSVKWVGFFTMALVGLYTISDLWEKFGDLEMPKVGRRSKFF
jgi:dolichyl-phosphate-mannose-protein mannosyltransferase